LSAVERIDRKQIEKKQEIIDEANGFEELVSVGSVEIPSGVTGENKQRLEDRNQRNVNEWPGSDTPQHGAGTTRRIDERDAAERPQNNVIGLAAGLPAGERVTEFVEKDDGKEREVFVNREDGRTIVVQALSELPGRDDEPGKVQVNLDAAELEEPDGALHCDFQATAERARTSLFYKVISAGVSVEISRRIGNMDDS
jgi:hypothetical protein